MNRRATWLRDWQRLSLKERERLVQEEGQAMRRRHQEREARALLRTLLVIAMVCALATWSPLAEASTRALPQITPPPAPATCAIHPDRPIARYGVCRPCLNAACLAARDHHYEGRLPTKPQRLAVAALDLEAAAAVGWPWAGWCGALRAALEVADG